MMYNVMLDINCSRIEDFFNVTLPRNRFKLRNRGNAMSSNVFGSSHYTLIQITYSEFDEAASILSTSDVCARQLI